MTHLQAIVFGVWAMLSPKQPLGPDAPAVADAIEYAVSTSETPPVTGSVDGDAALQATYAYLESGVREHPKALSWDARGHVSCGVWQMPCKVVAVRSLRQQAGWWLYTMKQAVRLCPDAPGADMCGSCHAALPRRMAIYRWRKAAEVLRKVRTSLGASQGAL